MKRIFFLFLCLLIGLSGCMSADETIITPDATSANTKSLPTNTIDETVSIPDVTSENATPLSTNPIAQASEVPIPVPVGASVPWPNRPITPQNASLVEPLARWGKGVLNNAAWSPDNQNIAAATPLGIYIYDASTFQEVKFLPGSEIYKIAYSPDGTMLVSGSGVDGTVLLWDLASGKILHSFVGHTHFIGSLEFSPNGDVLATSAYEEAIKLWDVASGQELHTLSLPGIRMGNLGAFSPDGKILASFTENFSIVLWDVASGEQVRTIDENPAWIYTLCFSPDGSTLASASEDNKIRLWDTTDGKEIQAVTTGGAVMNLSYLPGSKLVAYKPEGEPVTLWDTSREEQPRTLPGTESGYLMVVSHDGKQVLTYDSNSTIHIWDLADGKELLSLSEHIGSLTGIINLAFSPDGVLIAFQYDNQKIHLWDALSSREVRTITLEKTDYTFPGRLVFSPDGSLLASGTADKAIKIWEVSSGAELRSYPNQSSWVTGLAFSPDGTILAAGIGDSTIKLWDIASGGELRTMGESKYCYGACLLSLAYSPDGKLLAAGYDNGSIILWEAATGHALKTLKGHVYTSNNWVKSLAFSPDGSILASGIDSTIKLWDVSSWQEIRTLEGQTDEGGSLVFSPDGKTLASGSMDKNIRLWEVTTGKEMKSLEMHNGWVIGIAFSPDGKVLVSGSEDGTVGIWGIPPWMNSSFPEPTEQPDVNGSISNPAPIVQPTPEVLGVEKKTIPLLVAAEHIAWDYKWSLDGSIFLYSQWGKITPENAEQGIVTMNFINAKTGEVCTGLQEAVKFDRGYPSGVRLGERTSWLPDGRLLYISPTGSIQAITPCSASSEDLSSLFADQLTSMSYHPKQDSSQIILRGKQAYWLFTPGNRGVVRFNLPVPSGGFETSFGWSPWEAKIVSIRLEERQERIWGIVEEINPATGEVSLITEYQAPEEIRGVWPMRLNIQWLSKDHLLMGDGIEGTWKVIDISRQPAAIIDVFADLFGLESQVGQDLLLSDGVVGSGGKDYHLIFEEGDNVDGAIMVNRSIYLYHADTGLVEQLPSELNTVLIFPNAYSIDTNPWALPPKVGEETYQIVYVDTDKEPVSLVVKGHRDRQDPMKTQILVDQQLMVFSSTEGISMADMNNGKILHYWEIEDHEKYQSNYGFIDPSGKTIIGWARHDDPEGKTSMEALFWTRVEP